MLPLIDRIPEVQTLIGVIFAVTGNILISIALNLQKHAHNELRRIDYDSVAFNDTCDESNLQYSTSLYDSDPSIHEQSSNIDDDYVILSGFDDYDKPHYLHSKAWWAGILLMITGELGNFIAYAYAPASVVAPLGTVALISNVILAPIMLKERFRTQDLIGVIIAIIGAVVVVFNSKSGEVKLSPEAILAAILQMKFRIYLLITSILTLCLLFASNKYGHKLIFIDLSLVAIFGGYTVLATKSISSLLTETFISMFADPLTYLLFFVLLSTAVLQVKYFNKSLSQFDSTEVIPTQFVLFTISAVIGSAVLYNDFANMDVWKCAGFLVGCLLTFLGVFLVTSNRSQTRGYALISKNPTPAPLSSPIAAITEDDSIYNSPIEINRRLSPNTYRQISTNSPYRHALIESNVNIATPLLHGELYPANYHHHSRNDNGIFRSLVDVSVTTITGVGQALNSVGTHHSHALGLDQVIENYSLKIKEERNRLNNNTGSNSNNINSNNNINDDHHHSYSFPVANGAFVYSSNDFNYLNSINYSKGNVGRNGYNSMIPNNIDVNNFNAQVDNNRNRNNNKNGQSTNSLHIDTSFANSGHYNTGYNVESMGDDYKNYDGDGIKTPNNVIGISNGGGGLHYDENNDDDDDDDDDDDNSGDSYDVFSNGGDDYMGADLLDLPSSDNII